MVDGDALVMLMAMILSKFPILAGRQNRVSGSKDPKVIIIETIGGDGCGVRITCVHRVLMLCSSALLKGAP